MVLYVNLTRLYYVWQLSAISIKKNHSPTPPSTHTRLDKADVWNLCCMITYEGKSLNNRNFILKCMGKYAQWKILFRDTKWLLSNMPMPCRRRDNRAVWACSRSTVNLHQGRAMMHYSFFVVRGCETFWNLQKNESSVWRQLSESGDSVWMGGKISKWKTKCQWWTQEWETS